MGVFISCPRGSQQLLLPMAVAPKLGSVIPFGTGSLKGTTRGSCSLLFLGLHVEALSYFLLQMKDFYLEIPKQAPARAQRFTHSLP